MFYTAERRTPTKRGEDVFYTAEKRGEDVFYTAEKRAEDVWYTAERARAGAFASH